MLWCFLLSTSIRSLNLLRSPPGSPAGAGVPQSWMPGGYLGHRGVCSCFLCASSEMAGGCRSAAVSREGRRPSGCCWPRGKLVAAGRAPFPLPSAEILMHCFVGASGLPGSGVSEGLSQVLGATFGCSAGSPGLLVLRVLTWSPGEA